jgi:hypothetical protein
MAYRILAILSLIFFTSCELIVIGEKNPAPKVIVYDQTSSVGTFFLFKTELDNGNVPAATSLLASPEGRKFMPYEHYELYYDIDRIKRSIAEKKVTEIKTDTITTISFKHQIELDYVSKVHVTTVEIDSLWYIIKFDDFIEVE